MKSKRCFAPDLVAGIILAVMTSLLAINVAFGPSLNKGTFTRLSLAIFCFIGVIVVFCMYRTVNKIRYIMRKAASKASVLSWDVALTRFDNMRLFNKTGALLFAVIIVLFGALAGMQTASKDDIGYLTKDGVDACTEFLEDAVIYSDTKKLNDNSLTYNLVQLMHYDEAYLLTTNTLAVQQAALVSVNVINMFENLGTDSFYEEKGNIDEVIKYYQNGLATANVQSECVRNFMTIMESEYSGGTEEVKQIFDNLYASVNSMLNANTAFCNDIRTALNYMIDNKTMDYKQLQNGICSLKSYHVSEDIKAVYTADINMLSDCATRLQGLCTVTSLSMYDIVFCIFTMFVLTIAIILCLVKGLYEFAYRYYLNQFRK